MSNVELARWSFGLGSLQVGLAIALVFASVTGTAAKDIRHGDLTIAQVWSRATPPAAKVGAGYLSIKNTGSSPDRLIDIKSSVAGKVEVHSMKMDNGIMRMRPIQGGLELPPGKTVELKPGGLHLMFMKLKSGLKKGQPFKATLVFEKAGEIELEFSVEAIGANPQAKKSGGHGHTGHGKKQ